MQGECRNIYKTARRSAGFTQEAAAERLGISVESIRAYETGQRIPPNDIVELMVICYNAQHLAYQHLQETNNLMRRIVPALEQRTVLEASIRIYNLVRRLERNGSVDMLLEIAEDGVIDTKELPVFEEIVALLQDLVKGSLELAVFCDQA